MHVVFLRIVYAFFPLSDCISLPPLFLTSIPRFLSPTAVLPDIPHSNSCKRVSNRPLRRGRFGPLQEQLQCGIYQRTAVSRTSPFLPRRIVALLS